MTETCEIQEPVVRAVEDREGKELGGAAGSTVERAA
jgi:hypothetical protein